MSDTRCPENCLRRKRRHITCIRRCLREDAVRIAVGKAELCSLLHGQTKGQFPRSFLNSERDTRRYGAIRLLETERKKSGIYAEVAVVLDAEIALVDLERNTSIEFFDRVPFDAGRSDLTAECVPAEITGNENQKATTSMPRVSTTSSATR